MTDGPAWSASEVQDAADLVAALMEDRANGIMFVLTGRAQVDVGLSPEVFDRTRRLVDQTLSAEGLNGIATFTTSSGLSFG